MARMITFEARTDVGRERSENQDYYGSLRQEDVEFFIVCDGMGGHAGGSTASRLGVETIVAALECAEGTPPERMEIAVQAANRAISTMSAEKRELRGMGTTVVVMAIDRVNDCAHLVHVGDSRIYRLRGNVFQRLTRDHTMVQRLVDEGILTEEEAENHPNSNVISRSLGGHHEVDVEHAPEVYPLEDGDIFLLCTDGLSGLISETEMAQTLVDLPLDEAAVRLVDRANQEGGPDNITVELVRVGGPPGPFQAPLQLIHPPKGPSAREMREAEARRAMIGAGLGKTGETVALSTVDVETPPYVLEPPKAVGHSGYSTDALDEVEDGGTGRLVWILGALTVLLLVVIGVLLARTLQKPQDPDAIVPSTLPSTEVVVEPDYVEELEYLDPTLEEIEAQPVYEVPEHELDNHTP